VIGGTRRNGAGRSKEIAGCAIIGVALRNSFKNIGYSVVDPDLAAAIDFVERIAQKNMALCCSFHRR
jgi:hypothetical protein